MAPQMKSILKQTSWLFLAQAIGRVIGFFYTIFLARNLGVSEFGLFSVALAYFSLISAIADFGFNRFLIREVSCDHLKVPELLFNIIMMRLTLTSILFALFAVIFYLFDSDKMRISVSLLGMMAVLPQAVAITFDGIFVALQKLQYSSVALLISSLSTAFLGWILVMVGFGTLGAINALIFGQVIFALVLFILLRKTHILHLYPVKFSILKKISLGSLPYGLLGILGLLYFRIDILLLAYIRGSFEAGLYGAAYKFLESIVFVPSALATALFPVLARLHDVGTSKIRPLYFTSIKLMAVMGLIIALGYIVILPIIIRLFLPNYLPSIEAIKILAFSIPFMFVHVPGAQVLISTDKYLKAIILFSLITLSFNIITNLIFIPKFGLMAASWVTVLSEALSFIIFFQFLRMRVFR